MKIKFGLVSDHNLLLVRYECKVTEKSVAGRGKLKWRLKAGNWSWYRDLVGVVNLAVKNDVDGMNSELISKMRNVAEEAVGRLRGERMNKGRRNVLWSEEVKKARQERKDKCRPCRRMCAMLQRGEGNPVKYDRAWKEHVSQQKHVEGGKDWFCFLLGKGREKVKVEELVVIQRICGKEQVAKSS